MTTQATRMTSLRPVRAQDDQALPSAQGDAAEQGGTRRAGLEGMRFLLVAPRPLTLEGFHIDWVEPASFDPAQVTRAAAVLVHAADPSVAREVCHRIRRDDRPSVYLAPILLLETEAGSVPSTLAQAVDGVATPMAFASVYYQSFAQHVVAIGRRIAQLDNLEQARDGNLALRVLRHLYVRERRLTPVHDILTPHGYHYPELDLMLGRPDENVFDVLAFLEGQRLLTGEFVDRAYYCAHCGSAFLNFRESCPQCHSADLVVEDLIHHFRCAHVAPKEDYERDGGLFCPKCERELKQIGVDYDKPSSVYICNACRHTTQDPETTTLCYHCGSVASTERLGQRTIRSYTLTALAQNAALYGLDNLFRNILEGEIELLPLNVFKRFLKVELARMRRYSLSHSSLVLFYVRDLDRLYMEAGSRAKEIFGEFGRILHATLRPSDVITAFNDSLFLILATETRAEGAAAMAERVTQRFNELLLANFGRSADIATDQTALHEEADADALIDRLVGRQLA